MDVIRLGKNSNLLCHQIDQYAGATSLSPGMKMKTASFFSIAIATMISNYATAEVVLFLGQEYQAQAGTNARTIRSGDPASDASFTGFLNTAQRWGQLRYRC